MSEEDNTKAFNNTVQALLNHGLDMDKGLQIIEANTISEIKYQLDAYQSHAGPWLCILQSQKEDKRK